MVTEERLTFTSSGSRCSATLYLPDGGRPCPCLVMGHGFTGTQDQLEPHARRFAEAGIGVLTFDYRHFGRSAGRPRQLVDCGRHEEDWRAAVALALLGGHQAEVGRVEIPRRQHSRRVTGVNSPSAAIVVIAVASRWRRATAKSTASRSAS